MDIDHARVTELEHQTWRALSTTDGSSFLGLVDEELTMLLPGGMVVTLKSDPSLEEILRSEHFVPWKEYEMSDVKVSQPGPHVAIVSYRVQASRGDADFVALMSSTWKFNPASDKWLLYFHQQSPY